MYRHQEPIQATLRSPPNRHQESGGEGGDVDRRARRSPERATRSPHAEAVREQAKQRVETVAGTRNVSVAVAGH